MRSLVYRHNIHHDQPLACVPTPGRRRWKVTVWAKNETATASTELKNQQPCMLNEMAALMQKELHEVMEAMSPCTDAGFDIYLMR